jgi:hypothetical protein
MSRSRTERAALALAALLSLGTTLAGCSSLYYDRRETIVPFGGDAVAANAAMQTVDPWPPNSGNTNLAFNGQKMQSAVERYRNNKVTPPADTMTLQVNNAQQTPLNSTQTNIYSGNASQANPASSQVTSAQ